MVAWVTAGFVAPGVREALGKIAAPTITSEPVDAAGPPEGVEKADGVELVATEVGTGLSGLFGTVDDPVPVEQPVNAITTTPTTSSVRFIFER
jgi:hypothetical protein